MKTILLPYHDEEAARSALSTAILVAKRFDSYLEGLLVMGAPHIAALLRPRHARSTRIPVFGGTGVAALRRWSAQGLLEDHRQQRAAVSGTRKRRGGRRRGLARDRGTRERGHRRLWPAVRSHRHRTHQGRRGRALARELRDGAVRKRPSRAPGFRRCAEDHRQGRGRRVERQYRIRRGPSRSACRSCSAPSASKS